MKHPYLIQSSALSGFQLLVNQLEGCYDVLLKQCHLSVDELAAPDTLIPHDRMVNLLELCAHELSCPDFGLRLGSMQNVDALGHLGTLLIHSHTLREAFTYAQRYMAVHSQAEYWRLTESDALAYIERYSVSQPNSCAPQTKELSFSVCLRFIRLLIDGSFILERVEFAHAPVSSQSTYKKFFGCDVYFNQEHDRIVAKKKYLDLEIRRLSVENKHQVEQQLKQSVAQYDDDLARQITTVLLQRMGMQEVSIDVVAQLLNMHKRTLQRRLKEQGSSFKALLMNVRIQTACWHLEASTMDITLLSETLGYRDVSAFSRAFKHEKGRSPLKWRKAQKALMN